jgi:hypothetical protein
MKVHTLAARAILGGFSLTHLPYSPNNNTGLALRQTGTCDPGFTECGTGCMAVGRKCCGV